MGEEELEEFLESDVIDKYFNKYKKGGKEFYIGSDDFSSNITFLYFIDKNTYAAVSLEKDSKVFEGFEFGDAYSAKDKPIPKKIAHKIFDDLQMISLAELEKIGKK